MSAVTTVLGIAASTKGRGLFVQ